MPTVSGYFTCDNSFAVWVGDRCTVQTQIFEDKTSNDLNAIRQGFQLPAFEVERECFLYIITWSDDKERQGLIGSFTGGITLNTGDPRWRVLGSQMNKDDSDSVTKEEINNAIRWADCGDRNDWATPFVGPPNDGSEPFKPHGVIGPGKISPDARWVWYDSGNDPGPKWTPSGTGTVPFTAFAGNHDEFLIFRIPCGEFFPDGVRSYSVKFVCGKSKGESLAHGQYRTEINILNSSDRDAQIEKYVYPTILNGRPVAREPEYQGRKASDGIVLPSQSVTMDDCCRLADLLVGDCASCDDLQLMVGFLELVTTVPLEVAAVYTVRGKSETSIDVETVEGFLKWEPDPEAVEPGRECRDCTDAPSSEEPGPGSGSGGSEADRPGGERSRP